MQEIQPARNVDMTCYKALMSEPATCSQVVPTSRNGQWTPIAGSALSIPCSSQEDLNDVHQAGARPVAPHSRWRQNALHPPLVQHGAAGRDTRG